jgi:hypothetical protein
MDLTLVETMELRKTGLLVQVWNEAMRSRETPMRTECLLDAMPPEVVKYCAWGSAGAAQGSTGIKSLGGEFKARLTSSGDADGETRQHAGVVAGMMSELGNEMRFAAKPACKAGAFRSPSGRHVKYRVAAVPTSETGDGDRAWLAVGDWTVRAA